MVSVGIHNYAHWGYDDAIVRSNLEVDDARGDDTGERDSGDTGRGARRQGHGPTSGFM